MQVYKHTTSGVLLRLVKLRKSNINTFVEVNENGSPIILKRRWSTRPDEQLRLIKGFDNLEIIKS